MGFTALGLDRQCLFVTGDCRVELFQIAIDVSKIVVRERIPGPQPYGFAISLGGLWQAVVFGFAGVRPSGGVLLVDPVLPSRWSRLRIRLRFQNVAIRLDLAHDRVVVDADGAASLSVCGIPVQGSADLTKDENGWRRR